MADRIISPEQDESEEEVELDRELRPLSLSDFTGQEPLKDSLIRDRN